MKKLIILFVIIGSFSSVKADILDSLVVYLRSRVGEMNTSTSFFADTTAEKWLNQSQDKIARLAGFIENVKDTIYPSAGNHIYVPSAGRGIRSVLIKTDGIWYNISTTNPDPTVLQYEFIRDSDDSGHIFLDVGGYVSRYTDKIFDIDSTRYLLPAHTREISGAMVYTGEQWETVILNPYFTVDTSSYQYFVGRANKDTAWLYLRATGNLVDGDTVRVFYTAGVTAGDSVKIVYYAAPEHMTSSTECDLPDDLEVFVVEEAIGMYEQARKNAAAQQATYQGVRMDLGLYKQEQVGKE